jgi:hypothetical protein
LGAVLGWFPPTVLLSQDFFPQRLACGGPLVWRNDISACYVPEIVIHNPPEKKPNNR